MKRIAREYRGHYRAGQENLIICFVLSVLFIGYVILHGTVLN